MRCARCRRPLIREPIVVDGRGYGPKCAAMQGDLLASPVRRAAIFAMRKPRKRDERQMTLEAQQ